jgi:hypothetical protein
LFFKRAESLALPSAYAFSLWPIEEKSFEHMKKHNDYISGSKDCFSKIDKPKITDGFLYSLSTNKPEFRAFLSCYAIARVLPIHDSKSVIYQSGHSGCSYCGYSETFAAI